MYVQGFALMDRDKDGILGKEDLRGTWDAVGKLVSDKDLDEMLHEAPGPVNFTQLLSLFANRMAGGMIEFFSSYIKCLICGRSENLKNYK